jgi:hypothetical protein
MLPARAAKRTDIPSIVRQPRRRAGMPNSSRQARVAPPVAYQGIPLSWSTVAEQPEEAAVVAMVSVAVPAAPVILTGVVVPKLRVGGATAPVGLDVTAAVSATLPVNPPAGVKVIVEVFPVVAPGATVTAAPLTVKLGAGRLMV